jgi:cell division protein FtsI (penicillin-binding protein 3)
LVPDSSDYSYSGYTKDMEKVMDNLNVHHIDSSDGKGWGFIYNNKEVPTLRSELIARRKMPDVRKMTLKDALYVLENMNLKVIIKGKGKVVEQDVPPGNNINKNQIITLLLNQ